METLNYWINIKESVKKVLDKSLEDVIEIEAISELSTLTDNSIRLVEECPIKIEEDGKMSLLSQLRLKRD